MTLAEAGELAGIERDQRHFILNVVHELDWLKRYAAQRLVQRRQCAPGSRREDEAAWGDLAFVEHQLGLWVAAYCLMAFGSARERYDFVFHPERREAMIDRILIRGGFLNDESRFVEVPL